LGRCWCAVRRGCGRAAALPGPERRFTVCAMSLSRAFLLFLVGLGLGGALGWRLARDSAPPRPAVTSWATPPPPLPPPKPAVAQTTSELTEALEADNARLRQALAAARAERDRLAQQAARTDAKLATLRRPLDADLVSSTLRASVRPGEVVVTGGQRAADGRRVFAFVEPVRDPSTSGGALRYRSQVAYLSDAAAAAVGLSELSSNAANTLQHGEVWLADERRAVLERLATLPDTEIVPLQDSPGALGQASRLQTGPYALSFETGAGEGADLDLELRLEYTPPAINDAP
jgi:hypothetical protein